MKISGFTFLRNAHKLHYPVAASILSILDLVDEFVVALGDGDADDNSRQILEGLASPKIKIVSTRWDLRNFPNGSEYAHQTDLAKQACTGDWLFYLQGDEVIHEADIPEIREACQVYLNKPEVEGFVFQYLHFWGDYRHYFSDHCWYKKEIRIIRNLPDAHSWRDAQSFRYIPDFVGNDYFRKTHTRPLACILLTARVFHYGWVRSPHVMNKKNETAQQNYFAKNTTTNTKVFDYGRLDYCKYFKSTHPKVMQTNVQQLDWQHLLRFSGPVAIGRPRMKHEKFKYRLINWIEEHILRGYVLGGFKNYKILRPWQIGAK
jgi:hypothetical protein